MSWGGQERSPIRADPWSARPEPAAQQPQRQKSASYVDLLMKGRTINDVMQEFQMNGFDSPYNPDEDQHHTDGLSGLGPSGVLLRQKSWPDPERTPIQRLPNRWSASDLTPSLVPETILQRSPSPQYSSSEVTEEQRRVLESLPQGVVRALLRGFEREYAPPMNDKRPDCRFCRNNGERESYCRSHALKDAAGRVTCPVLRALRCRRCGARGDRAHTIKYCPQATPEERIKSTAMMRSVRLASGRRRAAEPEYVMFGAPPGVSDPAPLHPLWAALEQKLML